MPPQQTREQFVETLFALKKEDNLHGEEGRLKLMKGINKGVEAVKVSYGSAGSNALLEEDLPPFTRTSNDGKAILGGIRLSDTVENMGLNVLKEVADRTDHQSGDGRKTAIVLTGAILKEGEKSDASPMEIKQSLDECLPLIMASLDKQTKQITPNEVGMIATIASENEKLGSTFQEIYQKIGSDGIIELDNSNLPETFYEVTEGVRLLNCGFHYPYMANDDKGRKAVYMVPKILIAKQKISNITELDRIFKACGQQQIYEMVIFCNEIDLSVSQTLAQLHRGIDRPDGTVFKFKTLVIKAPTLWKDWIYEDFAKLTGATIVDPVQGVTFKNVQLHHLGTCDKVITSKDETVLLGTRDATEWMNTILEEGTDDSKIRASRLKTKTAILKLGANSETELGYVRAKALDARNASFLALNGGVVGGGGLALLNASKELPDTVGGRILREALQYPIRQILENSGFKAKDFAKSQVLGKTKNQKPIIVYMGGNTGFDSKKNKAMDMWKAGILDPVKVVKTSVTNALSVASMVLTTRVVVTKPK